MISPAVLQCCSATNLTAGLQEKLVNAPVSEVLTECQHAHVVLHMELSCSVEVQNGVEGAGVAIKKISGDV